MKSFQFLHLGFTCRDSSWKRSRLRSFFRFHSTRVPSWRVGAVVVSRRRVPVDFHQILVHWPYIYLSISSQHIYVYRPRLIALSLFYFTTNWSIDSNPTNPPPNHQRSDPITSIIRQRPLWLMQKGNWHLCSYVCGHSLCMELIPCLCLSGCPSAVYIPPPVFIARLQSCSFSVCKTAPADLRPPPAS